MHDTARLTGEKFFQTYWQPEFKRVLDIGSMDVNGTLRDYAPAGAEYVGVDLSFGPSVDVVLNDPYDLPFPDKHFDAIVSTSCFEHDDCFWMAFLEAMRVLADTGFLYISAPSNGEYHAYPQDNWRFYPDCGNALANWAFRCGKSCFLLESFWAPRSQDGWVDMVMVFSPTLQYTRMANLIPGCTHVYSAP